MKDPQCMQSTEGLLLKYHKIFFTKNVKIK
jgi:hypothetical protein